jgi:WD40 repeat protein
MRMPAQISVLLLMVATLVPALAKAQSESACPLPASFALSSGKNIFTPQQEIDLGDVLAEQLEHRYRILEDDKLSAYLNQTAQHLLAQMPPTQLRFQVFLYDDSEANAFSLPGGRIYVSRKLVAFVRSDDELAGLLGHEMGHILSHQAAIEQSLLLQKILGVTVITTRQDIADKYNQLLDNASRKPQVFEQIARQEEPDQYTADRIALYAEANAGYSPQALLEFWDRFAQTHGKAGGFFADWFSLSKPAEKRLGEMRKSLASLPAGCLAKGHAEVRPEFLAWQASVVGYSGLGHREVFSGLLSTKTLDPALRGDITNLRFSADGKYVLAQDDSSVFVLTRDPFALLFRFDAPAGAPAQFTPDSKDIVYNTRSLRVEDWNIATQARISAHEFVIVGGCVQSLLSPDGKYLACLNDQFDLQVYDTASTAPVFTKKAFFIPNSFQDIFQVFLMRLLHLEDLELIRAGYSPDARYFVAACLTDAVAVDLATHSAIPMHGALRENAWGGFAFLTPDTVIVENRNDAKNSSVVQFPSGKILQKVPLGDQRLSAPAHGAYVLLRPTADALVGVLDLTDRKFVLASKKSPALDLYDQQFVAEQTSGQIGLFDVASRKLQGKVDLSLGPLGELLAADVSADFRWLAVSGKSRGAVWDLPTMNRLYFTRGFRGAYFGGDQALYVDFPKEKDTGRRIVRANLSRDSLSSAIVIDSDSAAVQEGAYLMITKPAGKQSSLIQNVTLEMQDVRSGHPLWSATFPKDAPEVHISASEDRVVLEWRLETAGAKEEIKKNPVLQARYSAMTEHAGGYLLEVLDAETGKSVGANLVDTGNGSFKIEGVFASGDWLLLGDQKNRTFVYSAATGELKGTIFGSNAFASSSAGLLAVEPADGELQFYSLASLEKLGRASFSSPVALRRFNTDGKRLFILTKNQTVYVFDSHAVANTNGGAPTVAADPAPAAQK